MTKGKTHKVVRFLISPKKKKVKIEVNKIMNPAFLLGTAFNIAYWHRKSPVKEKTSRSTGKDPRRTRIIFQKLPNA